MEWETNYWDFETGDFPDFQTGATFSTSLRPNSPIPKFFSENFQRKNRPFSRRKFRLSSRIFCALFEETYQHVPSYKSFWPLIAQGYLTWKFDAATQLPRFYDQCLPKSTDSEFNDFSSGFGKASGTRNWDSCAMTSLPTEEIEKTSPNKVCIYATMDNKALRDIGQRCNTKWQANCPICYPAK